MLKKIITITIILSTSCASNITYPIKSSNRRTTIAYESEPKKIKVTNGSIQGIAVSAGNITAVSADGMFVEQEHCVKTVQYRTVQDLTYGHKTIRETEGYLLGGVLTLGGFGFLIGAIASSPQINSRTGAKEDPTAALAILSLTNIVGGLSIIAHTISTKNKIKKKANITTDYETFDTETIKLPMSECENKSTKPTLPSLLDQTNSDQTNSDQTNSDQTNSDQTNSDQTNDNPLPPETIRTFATLKAEKYFNKKSEKENICETSTRAEFHTNGNIKTKRSICNNDKTLTGITYEFFEDGKTIYKIETYHNNKKDGYWFTFDQKGNIQSAQIFKNNNLLNESEAEEFINNDESSRSITLPTPKPNKTTKEKPKTTEEECFFDEETSRNVCCKQQKVLDKKTKNFSTKWVCDNNTTFNKEAMRE